MKNARAVLLVIPVLFLSGCVGILGPSEQVGGGLTIKLQPDPPQVFSLGLTRINVDLENENPRNISNVQYDLFDTGRLSKIITEGSVCSTADLKQASFSMMPGEFRTFFCMLSAPQIDELSVSNDVNARVSYRTDFPAVQVVQMMTEAEYLRKQPPAGQKSYSYSDKNIELDVEYSEPLPVVIREGKDYYVYFTIKNIGNGFISSLNYGDFSVRSLSTSSILQVLDCSTAGFDKPGWTLAPVGKEFPRIACKLVLPQGVTVVENYGLLVVVSYNYEVREKATVQIAK